MDKTLVVLERSNGYYSGYIKSEDSMRGYKPVFNASEHSLFLAMLNYYNDGCKIELLGKDKEKEFIKNNSLLD